MIIPVQIPDPMFNQTADGKGEPYVHQVRGADNLIGPPFEILSDKAVKYYEKLKYGVTYEMLVK